MINCNTNNRIDFIDLTKGLCIILVVMGHVGGVFAVLDYHNMISAFRMPLYFFISGIFFKSYEGLNGFLLRKVNRLLIPFLFFFFLSFAAMFVIGRLIPHAFNIPLQLKDLFVVFVGHDLIRSDPPIWFFLALFNCSIIFYLVHYLKEKHLMLMFAIIIFIGALGFYLGKAQIVLPCYLDVSMTVLPFYALGFWIRRYNFFISPHHRFDRIIPLYVFLTMIILYFTATKLGMRCNSSSGNIFQFYIAGMAGILAILLICKKIKYIHTVSYIGRYSIITLGLHGSLLHFIYPLVTKIIPYQSIRDVLVFVFVILLCLFFTPLMLKYFPQFVAYKDFFEVPLSNNRLRINHNS